MESFSDKLKSLGFKTAASLSTSKPKSRLLLEDKIGGRVIGNSLGEFVLKESHYPYGYQHGIVDFQQLPLISELLKLARFENLKFPLNQFIFLDTETSGLSGGTGTIAFLVGIARFVESGLILQQFIIRDPLEEPAMLLSLQNSIRDSDIFVTYNGKSFDLPILLNRFRINKQPANIHENLHLDLLHVARRIWKNQLPSCGLKDLERDILFFPRTDEDIPGWMIPEIFFEYLRSNDPERISNVIYHNAIDIVSLAALFLHTGKLIQGSPDEIHQLPDDLYAIGKAYTSIGKNFEAIKTYTQFQKLYPNDLRMNEVNLNLGMLHKKSNSWESCLPYWTSAAEAGTLEACIELAKYYEHRTGNFQLASSWALKAKSIAEQDRATSDVLLAIDHRIERIKGKAGRNV